MKITPITPNLTQLMRCTSSTPSSSANRRLDPRRHDHERAADSWLAAAQDAGGTIRRVVLTDGHGDDVGPLDALKEKLGRSLEVLMPNSTHGSTPVRRSSRQASQAGRSPPEADVLLSPRCIGSLEVAASPGRAAMSATSTPHRTLLAGDVYTPYGASPPATSTWLSVRCDGELGQGQDLVPPHSPRSIRRSCRRPWACSRSSRGRRWTAQSPVFDSDSPRGRKRPYRRPGHVFSPRGDRRLEAASRPRPRALLPRELRPSRDRPHADHPRARDERRRRDRRCRARARPHSPLHRIGRSGLPPGPGEPRSARSGYPRCAAGGTSSFARTTARVSTPTPSSSASARSASFQRARVSEVSSAGACATSGSRKVADGSRACGRAGGRIVVPSWRRRRALRVYARARHGCDARAATRLGIRTRDAGDRAAGRGAAAAERAAAPARVRPRPVATDPRGCEPRASARPSRRPAPARPLRGS